jgi:hypothetical protein
MTAELAIAGVSQIVYIDARRTLLTFRRARKATVGQSLYEVLICLD